RTYKIRDTGGMTLALKIVDPTKSSVDRTAREIEALQKCESPRLSRYHSSGELVLGDTRATYLIEEFFIGGTLTEKLQQGLRLDRELLASYAFALTQAIAE